MQKNRLKLLAVIFSFAATANKAISANLSCNSPVFSGTPKKGDEIYLRGCGNQATVYYKNPLELKGIKELPNKVVSGKKTIYGKPFETQAVSSFQMDKIQVNARLENFRDLKITEGSGKDLFQRKISNASSLFELHQNGIPIGWAAGWHKSAREFYKDVDFTSFRVFIPSIVNGKMTIIERNIPGLIETRFQDQFKMSEPSLLVQGDQIGAGAYGCYYCLPEFLVFNKNQGFIPINDSETLEKHLRIDTLTDPLMLVFWAIKKKEISKAREYIRDNFDKIPNSPTAALVNIDASRKNECLNSLQQKNPFSKEEVYRIFDACFPVFRKNEAFSSWLEDLFI